MEQPQTSRTSPRRGRLAEGQGLDWGQAAGMTTGPQPPAGLGPTPLSLAVQSSRPAPACALGGSPGVPGPCAGQDHGNGMPVGFSSKLLAQISVTSVTPTRTPCL